MLATDEEIYAADYASNGAQTPEARDALAQHAVALNRDLRAVSVARRARRPQSNDHPWKNENRAMFESFRAHGRVSR